MTVSPQALWKDASVVQHQSGCGFGRSAFKSKILYLSFFIYMQKVFVTTSYSDTGFCCACDLLPGWVVGGSDDFETFRREVKESIDFYIECAKKDGDEYPKVFDGEYEIVYKFDVQGLLQMYQGIFSFSALQTITGINQKQLAHYAAGRSKPRPLQSQKIATGLHRLANQLQNITV